MTTNRRAIVGLVLIFAVGFGLFEFSRTARLRSEIEQLQQQNERITVDRDSAMSNALSASDQQDMSQKDRTELLRLRSMIGESNRQTNSLEKLRLENESLRDALSRAQEANAQSNQAAVAPIKPLILMEELPLNKAISALASAAGVKLNYDESVLTTVGFPGIPHVSVRWENVTARRALDAMLNNYNLDLVAAEPNGSFTLVRKSGN